MHTTLIDTSSLEMTCYACPSQWDAKTIEGDYVYIRFRHGVLSISLRDRSLYEGDEDGDGVMSTEQLISILKREGLVK